VGPCVIFDYFLIDGPTRVFPSIVVKLHMGSSDYYSKNLCHYMELLRKISRPINKTPDAFFAFKSLFQGFKGKKVILRHFKQIFKALDILLMPPR